MPFNPTTGVFTRVANSFSDPILGTVISPEDANSLFDDYDQGLSFSPFTKVANAYPGSDIAAKINAAIADLGSGGGTVVLIGGTYSNIGTTATISGASINLDLNGSILNFNAGVSGVVVTGSAAQFSCVSNGKIIGSDTVSSSSYGLLIQSPFFLGVGLEVEGFGVDSCAVLSGSASIPSGQLADSWYLARCLFRKSVRDNFHAEGPDSNKGLASNCEYQCFGRYGVYDSSSFGNYYLNPIFDGASLPGSTTTAGYISAPSTLVGVYSERSTDTIELAGGFASVEVSGSPDVNPTIIKSGAVTHTQLVSAFDPNGYPAWDSLNVMTTHDATIPYSYGFRINPSVDGLLELRDLVTGVPVLSYAETTKIWSMWGTLALIGATSGSTTITPASAASGSWTIPNATDTFVGKATTDTLTNKTMTAPTINGGAATGLTGLSIKSSGSAFNTVFATNEVTTAQRTLNYNLGDANRTLTLAGNLSVTGNVSLDNNGTTSYTPTLSAGSGTFTTASATGRYKTIGKLCYVEIEVIITTNGTAAGRVVVSLPFTAAQNAVLTGSSWNNVAMIQGYITSNISLTSVSIYTPSATYPGADGRTLTITGWYETV